MNRLKRTMLYRFYREESGQTLPFVVVIMIVMMGFAGIVVDVGHVYLCSRELQASADAAALAGATAMAGATANPLATSVNGVKTIANNYSSLSSKMNAYNNLPNVTMMSGYPQLKCLTTFQSQGISCVGYVPYNAVQVKLQSVIPLTFASLFRFPTMTIQAVATAVKGGGPSRPYNVAIIVDTTGSMANYDSDCGASRLQCSLSGVQILLQHLDPCGTSQPTCTIAAGNAQNSVARVSIFTFPQIMYSTVGRDYDCGGSSPTSTVFSFPSATAGSYSPGTSSSSTTYRVLDFQSDYRLSDTSSTLYAQSFLTMAAGGVSGCSGMSPPNNVHYNNTYYPAPMYAAHSALVQEQAAYPGSQNVMIIIGDGDANAPQKSGSTYVMPSPADASGLYPSYLGECGQGVTAAHSFSDTIVYTVAYGSPSVGGCVTDQDIAFFPKPNTSATPNIQPCNEMAQMATHTWTFFSDYNQSGSGSTCFAAQAEVALSDIFLQIAGDLTEARLVSDKTP